MICKIKSSNQSRCDNVISRQNWCFDRVLFSESKMAANQESTACDLDLKALQERLEFERLFPERALADRELREYHSRVIEKLSNMRNAILIHHHNLVGLRLQHQDLERQANRLEFAD